MIRSSRLGLLRQTRPRLLPILPRSWLPEMPPASSPAARPPGTLASRRYIQTQVFWLPPLFFFGLLSSLWVWKCLMMIVFQNKIIYMPGMPPNARSERIADYARQCGGIAWEERRIRAADGTDLALCVASVAATGPPSSTSSPATAAARRATPVYILYFQGLQCVPLSGPAHGFAHTARRKRLVAASTAAGPVLGPEGLAEEETPREIYDGLPELPGVLDVTRPALGTGYQY